VSAHDSDALANLRLASELAGIHVADVVLPADEYFVADGLRLHYLDWRTRGALPLLFLHGGRLTAHTWDLVCLALRSQFRCLALDQRGYGDSEWSPSLDYGPETNASDIAAWIAHLGVERPVLIGQSLGGLHAMAYAARDPARVRAMVLVDVGPGIRAPGVERIVSFAMEEPGPGSFEEFLERAVAFNPRRDPRLLRRSLLHSLRELDDGTWTWKHDPGRHTPEYLASTRASVERLRERASAIRSPVLVVRGAESDVFSDSDAARFAEELPDGRWAKVPAAGHNVQGDNPRGLAAVLTDFLHELAELPDLEASHERTDGKEAPARESSESPGTKRHNAAKEVQDG
jgi:pimeloyl-ACP methyl ester carboxylesterase